MEILLPKGKNKKVIELTKNQLGVTIMTEFLGLRAKPYSYLINNGSGDKKGKDTKNGVKKNLNLKLVKSVYKQIC